MAAACRCLLRPLGLHLSLDVERRYSFKIERARRRACHLRDDHSIDVTRDRCARSFVSKFFAQLYFRGLSLFAHHDALASWIGTALQLTTLPFDGLESTGHIQLADLMVFGSQRI
jgi:hypothetical protein